MKSTILSMCALFLVSISVEAQKLKESEVPAAVKASFNKSFPKVKKVEWSKESETEFEAEFRNGTLEQAANFDASGKWIVTETEIKKDNLPAAVLATIKREFDGYKIEEAEKVETPDSEIYYEVKVEKGEIAYSLEISGDGNVMKKEEEKEEKEN